MIETSVVPPKQACQSLLAALPAVPVKLKLVAGAVVAALSQLGLELFVASEDALVPQVIVWLTLAPGYQTFCVVVSEQVSVEPLQAVDKSAAPSTTLLPLLPLPPLLELPLPPDSSG